MRHRHAQIDWGARQTVQAHCKSRSHPPHPSPHTNYSATTKERQKTDIGKKHDHQTTQNQCKTTPKQVHQAEPTKAGNKKTKFTQKFAFADQLPLLVSFNTKTLLVHSGFRAFPYFFSKKNANTYLGENPGLKVMRNRTIADEHFRTTNLGHGKH